MHHSHLEDLLHHELEDIGHRHTPMPPRPAEAGNPNHRLVCQRIHPGPDASYALLEEPVPYQALDDVAVRPDVAAETILECRSPCNHTQQGKQNTNC